MTSENSPVDSSNPSPRKRTELDALKSERTDVDHGQAVDPWGTISIPDSRQVMNLESGYVMIRQIGRGNFGEVWLSEAPGGVEVALKLVTIPRGHRIKQIELRSLDLMKRLRHPFLMQVQAFWVSDEQITIAMELADESLRELAAEHGEQGMPPGELVRFMSEAAEGIDFLHREHVIHRDIKPENLLLLKGHIKVADFGLARFLDESRLNIVATQVAGSPLYMAPEVWEGMPVSASDQYSLAMTYVELRLGHSPIDSSSIVAIMKEHLHGQPDLSNLPEAEQQVLHRALAKRPEQRFASCTDMVQALHVATSPAQTSTLSAATKATSKLLYGVVLLMLTAAVVLAWALWPPSLPIAVKFSDNIRVAYGNQSESHVISLLNSDQVIQSVGLKEAARGLTVEYSSDAGSLKVSAELNVPVGSTPAKLLLTTPSAIYEKELMIEVIEASNLVVPDRAVPAAIEPDRIQVRDRIYHRRINIPLPSGQRLEFTLIPQKSLADPPTFYFMTREVTNRWFAEFVSLQNAEFASESDWRKGALAGTEFLGVEGRFQDYPVVLVTAEEAHAFARWIGGLLPTTDQWDKAAGANERQNSLGPYHGDGQDVCVDHLESGPCPGGSSHDDVSPYGILDMAGSVTELTRNILYSKLQVPLIERLGDEAVILRGNSYYSPVPWQYEDGDSDIPPSLGYDKANPDGGFRVVLEML